jgi:hypothetical protein
MFPPFSTTHHHAPAGHVKVADLHITTFLDAQSTIDKQRQASFITSALNRIAAQRR